MSQSPPPHDERSLGDAARPRLTIVICTWNRSQLLIATIESVLVARNTAPERVEIVIVDNASTDNTSELVSQYSERGAVRYLYEARPGLSNARNCGIAACQSEYVLFLDDDILVEPTFVQRYLDGIEAFPYAAFFGAPVVPTFVEGTRCWTAHVMRNHYWAYSSLNLRLDSGPLPANVWPVGANMCIRTEVARHNLFSDLLGFRHGQLIPGEESAFFSSLATQGYRGAWLRECPVLHLLPSNRNTIRFLVKRSWGQGVAEGRNSREKSSSVKWILKRLPVQAVTFLSRVLVHPARAVPELMELTRLTGLLFGYQTAGRHF